MRLAIEDKIDEQGKNKGVEIGHDKETDDSSDDAGKFNFFIGRNAVCDIVGDFLIKDGNGGTGGEN